jgi:hypothetical protein
VALRRQDLGPGDGLHAEPSRSPLGTGTIDFPGITILQYAGNGRWSREEDFWAVPKAYETVDTYAAACKEFDPKHRNRRTRRQWGKGPDWTRGGASWAERPSAR